MYGNDLKAKLRRDVLTISQQTLTAAQKTQVLTNIGGASASSVQSLSEQIGTVNNKVSSLLYVTTHDCVPGTTSTGNFSKNIAISGYTPIGIVGMEAISSFEPITKLGEWFINGNTLYYRTTAPSTTSGIRFLVLYKKN